MTVPGSVPVTVGVSLKMYFSNARTASWSAEVADVVRAHPAVADGRVRFFVIPTYLGMGPALAAFAGTAVEVGAQDLATEDAGAFTGEVSGAEIAEIGGTLVEVGHAERRRLFGETDEVVAAKTAAALRNGLSPLLCIGELAEGDPDAAAADSIAQLRDALAGAVAGPVIVGYEPVWAIGAPAPASADHIRAVARALRAELDTMPDRVGSTIIYGGSAGPGLLSELGDAVDGLFLGRFAHDPAAVSAILDEATTLADARGGCERQSISRPPTGGSSNAPPVTEVPAPRWTVRGAAN